MDDIIDKGDPAVAFIGGFATGIAGLFGWIKGDALAAATLLILSVVSFSLVRERSLRVASKKRLDEIDTHGKATSQAIESLRSAKPYRVLLHDNLWEMREPDGSVVHVRRVKHLRFEQNEVISLLDFVHGDGERTSEYSPGQVVHEFYDGIKRYSLIALDRIYSRHEEVDFVLTRTARDAFLARREEVGVVAEDVIDLLRMKILWHPERLPRSVNLIGIKPTGERRPAQSCEIKRDGEDYYSVIEVHQPERGGKTAVEWSWP